MKMIGRRNLLTMLGLGGAAAAVSDGAVLAALPHPIQNPTKVMTPNDRAIRDRLFGFMEDDRPIFEKIAEAQKNLADLQKEREEWIETEIIDWFKYNDWPRMDDLPPNYRNLKSLSENMRVRMWLRMKYERAWEREQNSLVNKIARLMEGKDE
jgi:hypothetical protein